MSAPEAKERRTSWLSLGFEDLVQSITTPFPDGELPRPGSPDKPFDVLIVGSGYGGAMAASQLAGMQREDGETVSLCILERGQEYLAGMFPKSVDELAGHVRFSTPDGDRAYGKLEGLFDFRLGGDVNVLVANGLGGGSLINAGVMLRPLPAVLNRGFPAAIGGNAGLAEYLQKAEALLGAADNRHSDDKPVPPKSQALRDLAKGQFAYVPITVALENGARTSAEVALSRCIQCGDCATGCNFNAKNSLDLNLLVSAVDRGARIYTGATVLRLERPAQGGWIVQAVPTDSILRERFGKQATPIHAARVILAAGTLGSTEILMRSQAENLLFSERLGEHFSANGDSIAVVYGHRRVANAVADEGMSPSERAVGPTITSMLDFRQRRESAFAIQELAIPGALRRAFEETVTTTHALHQLASADWEPHENASPEWDPSAVDPRALRRSTVVAMMGDDGAAGRLTLKNRDVDGGVSVRWQGLRERETIYDRQLAFLERLAKRSGAGGTVLANPVWRLLPERLSFLLDNVRGPAFTVHPLGGCRMADKVSAGVVNDRGLVYDRATGDVFPDLAVLDGSILPKALGINPALTIAALALRAAELLAAQWRLRPAGTAAPRPPALRERPRFRLPVYARKPEPMFSFVERLRGEAMTEDGPCYVELTLRFQPTPLRRLMSTMQRRLTVDAAGSSLRRFESRAAYEAAMVWQEDQPDLEQRLTRAAIGGRSYPLEGELRFFHREPSTAWERMRRGTWAYLRNRGSRDIYQAIAARVRHVAARVKRWAIGAGVQVPPYPGGRVGFLGLFRLATRAGEVRLFEYDLNAVMDDGRRSRIQGRKRFTYGFRMNIFEQLEDIELTRLLDRNVRSSVLTLDFPFFASENVQTPLARIETQANLASTWVELACFGGYLLRLLLNIHVWSFRRPDTPRPRKLQRLPGAIVREGAENAGLAKPETIPIAVQKRPTPKGGFAPRAHGSEAVEIRATRYRREGPKPPVLLIHGYSASGTTFAHQALNPGLAEFLWRNGRDVWVLDMRTSCGFESSKRPWTFEDCALYDIPAAIEKIRELRGPDVRIDVVAHCMGAAMFSMCALKAPAHDEPCYAEIRRDFPAIINRVVLSQVGPRIQFTPINVLRAYVMRYFREYLGASSFDFRVDEKPKLAEQLIDRALSALRYPLPERGIENPAWPPWARTEFVGARHRMDGLYGRAFSLCNVSREVLDNIDDFFGPLNFETLAQALHMARMNVITDVRGRNVYLNRDSRNRRWTFPTLTLHAADNGLVDFATMGRIDRYFNRDDQDKRALAQPRIQLRPLEGVGHQDSLIGTWEHTRPVFEQIEGFLAASDAPGRPQALNQWLVRKPWIGPILGVPDEHGEFALAAAANPAHGDAAYVVTVSVAREGERFVVEQPSDGRQAIFCEEIRCDAEGWFAVRMPPRRQAASADGLLVLLAYRQPGAAGDAGDMTERILIRAPVTEGVAAAIAGRVGEEVTSLLGGEPQLPRVDISSLQGRNVAAADDLLQITGAVTALLALHPARRLESALLPKPAAGGGPDAARILLASCQYPAGLLDKVPAWASYRRMDELLRQGDPTGGRGQVLILTGDQIYSDATAGLFDPTSLDDRYRRPHEMFLGQREVSSVLRRIPVAMMLDDHEIRDGWDRSFGGGEEGIKAYRDFQRRVGPGFPNGSNRLWFPINVGGAPIFVADSRTDRDPREPRTLTSSRIMSEEQEVELRAWLKNLGQDPRPKFVVTPAMLLPRRLASTRYLGVGPHEGDPSWSSSIRSDGWDGFPASLLSILEFILENEIKGVVFLSGDEHLFCFARAELHGGGKSNVVHSVHGSSLYSPYPFANAHRDDFALVDGFGWRDRSDRDVQCRVEAEILEQQGFAEIRVRQDGDRWHVDTGFHDSATRQVTWRNVM